MEKEAFNLIWKG